MDFSEANDTFFAECEELLSKIESGLLVLESDPRNEEEIHSLFRAIHTIKGSAGMFGYESIEDFAHTFENVLQKLRDQQIQVTEALIDTFLKSRDQLATLVSLASNAQSPDEACETQSNQLKEVLLAHLSGLADAARTTEGSVLQSAAADADQAESDPVPDSPVEPGLTATRHLIVTLHFRTQTFRDGFDPASFLRYLREKSGFIDVKLLPATLPALDQLDAESCYLSLQIELRTELDDTAIKAIFEFAADDVELSIEPRDATASPPGSGPAALTPDPAEQSTGAASQLASVASTDTSTALAINPAPEDLDDETEAEAAKSGNNRNLTENKRTFLRVDSEKLDVLVNFVGELVTSSAHILQIARTFGIKEVIESTEELSALVSEIRDSALQLRMIPIGQVLNKFQRIVRDISHELGKDVELRIFGAETELDKSVIESLSDPLMHIIRNAIDHGIESEADRSAAGKAARGTITINSWHETGEIVIEVSDDGKGIHRERVLSKAMELGYINAGENPTDSEIFKYLFYPGFSTAGSVTNLSGRGVGLDVVQKNIDSLRGKVGIQSRTGAGTTFQIRLPLTLAIIDGFLVRVANSSFVIPLDMMDECIELGHDDHVDGQMDVMNIRGEALGIIDTAQLYNLPDSHTTVRRNIVVIRYGDQRTGLLVDELLGEVQSVIKPMGKIYGKLAGIGGSTILGDGTVALIIDVASTLELARHARALPGRLPDRKLVGA
ncbi:MAG: chemotaxis protein CheA [Leptospiraceae bacterium]|nr:chemotaxis protein CheA [Leptospiraceae bacterium]